MPLKDNINEKEDEQAASLRLLDNVPTYDLSNLCLSGETTRRKHDASQRYSRQQQQQHSQETCVLYPSEEDLEELRIPDLSPQPNIDGVRSQNELPRSYSSESRSQQNSTFPFLRGNSSLPAWLEAQQQRYASRRKQIEVNHQGKRKEREPFCPGSPDSFSPSSYYTSQMGPPSLQSSIGSSLESSITLSSFEESCQSLQYSYADAWNARPLQQAHHSNRQYHPSPYHSPPSCGPAPILEIEVSPGCIMPLHGSMETMFAIQNGMARRVKCLVCNTTLSCVPDCMLVVCPDCRVLSPVEDERHHHQGRYSEKPHGSVHCMARQGVGLGVKLQSA